MSDTGDDSQAAADTSTQTDAQEPAAAAQDPAGSGQPAQDGTGSGQPGQDASGAEQPAQDATGAGPDPAHAPAMTISASAPSSSAIAGQPLEIDWSISNYTDGVQVSLAAGGDDSLSAPAQDAGGASGKFTLAPQNPSSLSITVTATGSDGNAVTSPALQISVGPSTPSIAITSPADQASAPFGQPIEIDWAITNHQDGQQVSLTVDGDGSLSVAAQDAGGDTGQFQITPASAGAFTLTANVIGSDGNPIASAPVGVNVQPPPPQVTSFTVAAKDANSSQQLPDSLELVLGETATLTWAVANADGLELTGPDSTQAITDGSTSLDVTPTAETNDYALVAIAGGLRSAPATVHISTHQEHECVSGHAQVDGAPAITLFQAAPLDGSQPAAGALSIASGASITLTWTWSGDGTLSLDDGQGPLAIPDGAEQQNEDGTTSSSFTTTFGGAGAPVTYTLTLTASAGAWAPVTAQVTVTAAAPAAAATANAASTVPADLAAGGPYTFNQAGTDGKGKPSLDFGLLCYQALLSWEVSEDGSSGVGYSNDHDPWFFDGRNVYRNEWPDVSAVIDAGHLSDTADNKLKKATVFGCEWTFSNYVNCCNSQLAAIFLALGGKSFSVTDTSNHTITYDVFNASTAPKTTVAVTKPKSAPPAVSPADPKATSNISIFQALFVSNMQYWTADKTALLWSNDATHYPRPGTAAGLLFLGLGKEISPYDSTETMRRNLRIGDSCASPGHAWLCGDVRYQVTFTDSPNGKPEIFLDQSSFLRASQGEPIPIRVLDANAPPPKKGRKPAMITRKADDRSLNQDKRMTAADCELARKCEDDFLARIDAFLAKDKPGAADATMLVGGAQRTIQKIEVANAIVFSANIAPGTDNRTKNGTIGDWTMTKNAAGKSVPAKDADGNPIWVIDQDATKKYAFRNGVSRVWDTKSGKTFAVTRFFPTDKRPPQEKLPADPAPTS